MSWRKNCNGKYVKYLIVKNLHYKDGYKDIILLKILQEEIENEVMEFEVNPKVKKLRIHPEGKAVKPKKKLIIIEEEEIA